MKARKGVELKLTFFLVVCKLLVKLLDQHNDAKLIIKKFWTKIDITTFFHCFEV